MAPAPRIVSLVPSLTAALVDLGREECVIGRTIYCPADAAGAATVGGTKNPDLDAIRALDPDVVLAVREENRREDVEVLRASGLRVEVFEPRTVLDGPPLARTLGRLAGDEAAGRRMADGIEAAIRGARARSAASAPVPAAYLVWREPWLVAGPETFIADVLRTAGFADVFPVGPDRYPATTLPEIRERGAAAALLSTEPFPFVERHREEVEREAGAGVAVRLVRGDLVGWYPSRIPAALEHLTEVRGTLG